MPSAHDIDVREFLLRTPFFGGLSNDALDRLVGIMSERAYPRGSEVFAEGDTGCSMYVVHTGELLASRRGPAGHRVRLMRFNPGDFFGETTLIEMQPRPVSVEVEKDARLFELTNRDLYKLYHQDVKSYVLVLQNINRELCRRLRKSDSRITQLAELANDEATQITTNPNLPSRPSTPR